MRSKMGREVRKVPADWQHPKDEQGQLVRLRTGYSRDVAEFMAILADPERGLQEAIEEMGAPDKNDYMPEWPESEATHLMMYETTSEGTPISPAFETAEELARWLADTGASAFASMTATYDQWLATVRRGFSVSMIYSPEQGLLPGAAMSANTEAKDETE